MGHDPFLMTNLGLDVASSGEPEILVIPSGCFFATSAQHLSTLPFLAGGQKLNVMIDGDLAMLIESSLLREFGPVLSNEILARSLGYPSLNAFRKALGRNTVPVKVFTLPRRSGKFALTREVAVWLASQRGNSAYKEKTI